MVKFTRRNFIKYFGVTSIVFLFKTKWLFSTISNSSDHKYFYIHDGLNMIEVVFSNPSQTVQEGFPMSARKWYNRDAYFELCKKYDATVIGGVNQGFYNLKVIFKNARDLGMFLDAYQSSNITNTHQRLALGVEATVTVHI